MNPQLMCGSERSVLDRCLRGMEDFADGLQSQSVEMPQFEYRSLSRSEFPQGAHNVCFHFSAGQLLFGIGGGSLIRDLIKQVLLFALYIHHDRAAFSTAPLPPQVIQANIRDDAVNPRREGAV